MDYSKIVLVHRIVVSLFLFHYLWKAFLLTTNKKEALTSYTAKTKIAEMVVSFLFLATGIYLCVAGPVLTSLQWIKIALVLASIPVAVIGFKRGVKPLAILSVVLLLAAYGLAEKNKKMQRTAKVDTTAIASDPLAVGKAIYNGKCARCHGEGGDAMIAGAKNLKVTMLSEEQQMNIIKNGNGGMPAYSDLTADEMSGLIVYLKTLKQ